MTSAGAGMPGLAPSGSGAGGSGNRSRRRRQEVVDAAARVFAEKGYDAASIQDIAEELGILKGSIYYYIDSKEDLLFSVIQEVHEVALANMERWRSADVPALVKVRLFVEGHLGYVTSNLVKSRVFFHDFRSLGDERREFIRAERDVYANTLRDLIAAGQGEGTVCPDVDPKLAAFAALGMTNTVYLWYNPGGADAADEIGRSYADLVVAGLACDPDTHQPGHRGRLGQLPPGLGEVASATPRKAPRTRSRQRT